MSSLHVTPGTACKDCNRPMRPNGKHNTTTTHPGTVKHSALGYCEACRSRQLRANKPRTTPKNLHIKTGTPCKGCKRPLRSRNTKKADAPHTQVHRASGYCDTCHRNLAVPPHKDPDKLAKKAAASTTHLNRYRKTQALPPRPKGLTLDELRLRTSIEVLIAERRRRGIPPEGLIPADEQQVAA